MAPIKILKTLDKPIAELPELAPLMGKDVEIVVREKPKKRHAKKVRRGGFAKGLIKMAPDFDAPLEDFKEYM